MINAGSPVANPREFKNFLEESKKKEHKIDDYTSWK
jgi:hypothetical protein